jgi:predicted Zn-dependent protease
MRSIIFILAAAAAAKAQDTRDPKEAALGAQLAQQIKQRTTAIENPAVQTYIEGIGRKLAPADLAYTFALISDEAGGETHEPLSLPGGYIFVSASLIRNATSEGEFAGMLAHAMAHVTLPRPQVEGATIPIVFIGGWYGLGPRPAGSLLPMSVLKTQRDAETRADALAVQAMSTAGYDPQALTMYIERVQIAPERAAKIFAVLPDRDTRIAALRQAIAGLPALTYLTTDPDEFGRIQEQVRSNGNPIRPAEDVHRPTLRRQN